MESTGVMEEVKTTDSTETDAAPQQIETTQPDLSPGTEGEPPKSQKQELSESEKGLIAARDAEAKKAREARQEAQRAREEAARAIRIAEQLTQQQQKPQENYDPDTPVTYADLEKREKEKEAQRYWQEVTKRTLDDVAFARDKYKDAPVTYDDALKHATENWTDDERAAVLRFRNPAQRLYDLVMLEPEYREKSKAAAEEEKKKIQTETVKKTVEKINEHINQPKTLSQAGGDNILDKFKKFDDMTLAEAMEAGDKLMKQK